MKIIDVVKKLDKLIVDAKIMEAFEEYFHEDIITHSSANDRSEGKAQKREFLHGFFGNMNSTDEVKLHDTVVEDDKSFSAFTFKFTNKQNEELAWKEIIQRTWKDGLVMDEYYFEGTIADSKKDLKHKASDAKKQVKETAKIEAAEAKVAKKLKKEATSKIKKTPAKVAEPIKKATSNKAKTSAKPVKHNLRLVEGIGPKIEQLLKADGITTFEDLAKAKQTKLKAILTAAGPRFTMHSPETWPQQAKLLAAGKKDELKKLQDELKGGRKV